MSKNTIMTYFIKKGGLIGVEIREETDQEERTRLENDKRSEERERVMRNNTEALGCDACGLSMGRVYALDLEGSRFYHDHCV